MRTRERLLATALIGSAFITGCMRRPVVYPNPQVDAAAAERDVDGCRNQAGSPLGDLSGAAAVTTMSGAVVGAVGGVVSGAIFGNPGAGAAAGAAGGAAASLVGMVLRPHEPAPAYRASVERCLQDRGYEIAAWQ